MTGTTVPVDDVFPNRDPVGRRSDYLLIEIRSGRVEEGMLNPFNVLKRPVISTTACAVVGETVVAESADTERVEGNHYFPPDAVNWEFLEPSGHTSVCPWKGVASYYDVVVDGKRLPAAAWTYKTPSDAAQHIAGYVAFWRGVKVVRV